MFNPSFLSLDKLQPPVVPVDRRSFLRPPVFKMVALSHSHSLLGANFLWISLSGFELRSFIFLLHQLYQRTVYHSSHYYSIAALSFHIHTYLLLNLKTPTHNLTGPPPRFSELLSNSLELDPHSTGIPRYKSSQNPTTTTCLTLLQPHHNPSPRTANPSHPSAAASPTATRSAT
jgi:hypothetical protein